MALPLASDNPYPSVLAVEGTTPASPSAGQQRLFVDSADHRLKRVNSSGTVTVVEGGSVAADAIWDTKGDLAVATGADTASKLAAGSNGQVLTADSTQATGLKWAPGGSLQPFVRVYHSTTQSVATATFTPLSFDSERYDQAGGSASTMHDNVTNNTRLTCREDGVYFILGTVNYDISTSGIQRTAAIRMNGATYLYQQDFKVAAGQMPNAFINVPAFTVWPLVATDYVELIAYHDKGSNITVYSGSGPVQSEFYMVRVA